MVDRCNAEAGGHGNGTVVQNCWITFWKFNSSPLIIYLPNRKVVFQPSFFRAELLNFWGVGGFCLFRVCVFFELSTHGQLTVTIRRFTVHFLGLSFVDPKKPSICHDCILRGVARIPKVIVTLKLFW